MRIFILIGLMFLMGCATPGQMAIKKMMLLKDIEKMDMARDFMDLSKYKVEKIAFLQAFAKVGFDTFEVLKLMEEDEDLNVRAFVENNKDRLLVQGNIGEIMNFPRFYKVTDDEFESFLVHLELNYKMYLKLLQN